jgi:hypothetical protein
MRRKEVIVIDGKKHLKCSTCKEILPIDEFHKCSSTTFGRQSMCKICSYQAVIASREKKLQHYRDVRRRYENTRREEINERHKQYYQENKEKIKTTIYEYYKDKPLVKQAHSYLARRIRAGEVERLEHCQICNSDRNIEAHHWLYDEAHWTDVIWMCRSCHKFQHEREKRIHKQFMTKVR